ncbi:TKL family protein kinase [Histomonas meleagridis]|uniref:TKL family protein kinase n=1 Tax=Histomonas meleagridis TaxID=135588 RepID=UPI00355A3FA8|nr:TKL family protein kinase [Histomonas meleagridis]KAH0796623.1 TKL family protein kinase [Histomonas meleagridis]
MDSSESLILKATVTGSSLFQLSQSVVVYRASVAYLLQHIQLFLRAIQPLKNKKLSDQEVGGLKMFQEILDSFQKLLPNLDKKWVNTILSWPSTKFHVYVHKLREKLRVACAQLSLDTKTVIPYSKAQDDVNKLDDLQNLRRYLQDLSQSAIARPNSIDIQQIIETRLRSISEIIGTSKTNSSTQPSSDNSRFIQLKDTIDKEFSLFNSIDIPNSDLEVGKVLGSGGFGTVYKGYRKSTGELLAIKEVRADKLSMSTWSSLYSEVATMLPLRHRYVLELVGVHIKEPYRIITRFCPGYSLFDRLHCRSKSKKFTPEKLTALAYQVAVGMEFLHSKDVVHRDLKTMNILLDDEDVAIIADFGLAGIVTDKGLMGGVGTPHYTAPEVLERRSYGSKIDSYSYGIILWEMATGKIPYDGLSPKEIYNQVVNKNYRLPLSERIPKCLKNLISRCWSSSPNERPDFTEIVPIVPMILANHPMLQSLLQIKEYKKQKLQIFTSLFLSEQFCYDTTIGDGVLNLVLSSMEDPDTVNYSIKLIGALSSHQYGCEIIQKTQIHSLVSQMFLSSIMTDVSTSLTILSNISQSTIQIPQISLIISCLMQDLNTTTIDKCEYLSTLINLVRSSPESVQEQDLCTSILPLLSVRQPPKLILLALRLCQACDHSLFRIFHIHVQQLLFNILNQEELLYPEIIEAVSSLIASIIVAHDMKEFVERTNLIQFLKNECKSIEGVYPEIAEAIKRNIYTIEVPSSLFSPSTLSHLAFANEKS